MEVRDALQAKADFLAGIMDRQASARPGWGWWLVGLGVVWRQGSGWGWLGLRWTPRLASLAGQARLRLRAGGKLRG